MKNMYFRSQFDFWKHFHPLCEGLDINRTLRLPPAWFADEDGDHSHNGMSELAEAMNARFDLNINTKLSYNIRQKFVVFFDEDEVLETKPLTTLEVEDAKESKAKEEKEELQKEMSIISEEDWEWINKLENKKYAKQKLDSWAEEKFGIKLNRVKKIENMIEDLKQAVSEL